MDPVPEGRYPSCEALADDLQRWLDHRAVSVVDASPWEVVQKIVRRHRLAVGIAAAASVALVAALTGGYLLKERERATAVAARQLAERALAQAEAQRRAAETGRRRERALASGSERQARRLERSRTVALLAQAEVALQRGRGGDAASILGEVAPEERDWTWRHLQARVAGSGDAQLSGRPDDRLVAAGAGFLVVSADGRLRLTSTAGQDRALAPLGRPVTSVAADPAGTSVVVGSATGGHLVLDGATGRMTASRLGGGVSRLVAVADGLVLSAQAQDVRWNGPGDQGERPWSQVAALTVSPDRGWWAVALPGSVVVHPMNEPERRLSAPERIDRLAASRDGTHLAAIGGARLRIWALPAGAIEADLTPGPELTAAAYAEGGVIALGTGQGEVLLWDPEVGLPLARLAAGQGAVADLAWTADGRALGARLADGSIRIWRE